MFNPPPPGLPLGDDVLPALGLNVDEAAAQLGVTRAALSRVLNGRAAISPEMALHIEGWLGEENGGRADVWTVTAMQQIISYENVLTKNFLSARINTLL